MNIVKESDVRVESDCKYSRNCGGCQLREMNYEAQLKLKEKQVKDSLERIGGVTDVKVNTIIGMAPKTVVYVSCKPSTLARDIKILVEGGYSVEGVQPFDMFPMTGHVETVVKLIKK